MTIDYKDDRTGDRLLLVDQINLELVHSYYSLEQDRYLILLNPKLKSLYTIRI